jgi:hypothetical protein
VFAPPAAEVLSGVESTLIELPTAGQASFLQAMVRDRVVADDWLVSVDANRYSVPCRLIGKTVQVVRAGGLWQIRYRGELVAEHAVLAARHHRSLATTSRYLKVATSTVCATRSPLDWLPAH